MSDVDADIRLKTGMPGHVKTKFLITRAGRGAAWSLITLWCYVGRHKPSGDISGWADAMIEAAADWDGKPGVFVTALLEVGYMHGQPGDRVLNDWTEHQSWLIGSQDRQDRALLASLCKRMTVAEAEEIVKKKQRARRSRRGTGQDASGSLFGSAELPPSPSPDPSPEPVPEDTPLPPTTEHTDPMTGFIEFYADYPRHEARARAERAWKKLAPDVAMQAKIRAAVTWQKRDGCLRPNADAEGRSTVPHPASWLNARRWEDEHQPAASNGQHQAPGAPHGSPPNRRLSLAEDTEQRLKRFAESQNEQH